MRGIEVRELECFLLLAEELHFGRVAMRLGLSVEQARDLMERLEHRIGTPLLDDSGERLRLSPFGEEFLVSLRPAYGALVSVLEDARDRASSGQRIVRLGFPGQMREPVDRAVKVFEKRSPEARVEIVETPLDDPLGPLRDGRVDAAVVLLPVRERDLVVGPVFDRQPQRLAVSAEHPLADREAMGVEDMARVPLIPVRRTPDHWLRVHAPTLTPLGKKIHHHEGVDDLQDGLRQVALKRGAMLLCGSADGYEGTEEVALVPVTGLPESSFGLVWPRGGRNPGVPALAAAFFEVLV